MSGKYYEMRKGTKKNQNKEAEELETGYYKNINPLSNNCRNRWAHASVTEDENVGERMRQRNSTQKHIDIRVEENASIP